MGRIVVQIRQEGMASASPILARATREGEAMTEAEWLSHTTDPSLMLGFLSQRGWYNGRKGRLFKNACLRRIALHLTEGERQALELVERLTEGDRLESTAWLFDSTRWLTLGEPTERNCVHAWYTALRTDIAIARAEPIERAARCQIVRDIFGNPFRPVRFAAPQLTILAALAQSIYDERAFDRLPILGDALEDAGCTDRAILDHCREPGQHVRGCWVVDLILGKQ